MYTGRCLTAGILLLVMSTATANLSPCPSTPNCVSSLALDADHRVEPISFSMQPEAALLRIRHLVSVLPRTVIVREEGTYLHAEVRSLVFRFVDDLELIVDADNGLIHVRSASRTGHSDLGVNRRRVERLRREFNKYE